MRPTATRKSYASLLASQQDEIHRANEEVWTKVRYVACKRAGIPVDADPYDREVVRVDPVYGWWNEYGDYLYTEAQRAEYEKVNEYFSRFKRLPKSLAGWKFLGSGCSRQAYLGPDGLVYKAGSVYSNKHDHRFSQMLRKCPEVMEKFQVPDTCMIDGILLMTAAIPDSDNRYREYGYNGPKFNEQREAEDKFERLVLEYAKVRAYDLHYENLYLSGGRWTIVDMGSFNG